ncbi:MAG: tetratricopeptide repeat protein [Bacteroidia bacterium]|nr:tetratricopeptide repeat protein [Bacteroidia bacterium]
MFSKLKNIFSQNLVLSIALIITLLVYFKFLFFGHISWDDPEMVFKNKFVRSFDIKGLFSNHFVGNYIPVTMLAHAIAWLFFENNDGAYHLVNILFHLLNGVLVYQLGKHLFKNDLVINLGAILFLLHPMQIESVGWISELKNVLSTTFYLAGTLSYINYATSSKKKDYILCLFFFILGCLSKPSVVIFPIVLICLDILLNKKLSVKFILDKIPFLLLALLFGIINIKTQTADQFINHSHEFPIYQRIGFAGFALLKYLILFLVPVNLSVIYPYPSINISVFVIGFFLFAFILVLVFLFIKQKKFESFFVILFIVLNLILVLQLLPFGEVLYADRYMYIPIIGFAWLLGLLLSKLKIPVSALSFVLILLFSVFSFTRANAWKSALNLYEDIDKKYPNQFIVLNSAGVENMFLNNDNKALEYLNKAVAVAPLNYKGFYNRGLLYLKNNKPEEAIKSFNQVLELYDYSKAYVGRATAYYMLQDFPKAINDANYVLKTEQNNTRAHFVLGNCYNDLNRLQDAMSEYNKCIELDKDEADFYFKRGIVNGKKQNFNACIKDIDICLKLKSDYYEAYYWRGVAKVNLKQNACDDFKIAAQKNYEPAIAAFNKFCQ